MPPSIDVCLVVTIVNTVNDDQVGPIIKFALQNCDKISFVSFQPVSFTGRDEDIADADRHAKRYTLSHLAEDVKRQTGVTEPLRDWFPLSASSRAVRCHRPAERPRARTGARSSAAATRTAGSAPPSWSARRRSEWAPLASFINIDRFLQDAGVIADAARGPFLTKVQAALSLLRNYTPGQRAATASGWSTSLTSTTSRAAGSLAASSAPATTRTASVTSGSCCSSRGCGSRISGLTISDERRCASSRTRRRWGRSHSARTTPGWAGGRSSRTCTRTRQSQSGTRNTASTRFMRTRRKPVPLPAGAQPVSLRIPRDGRLIEWSPARPARPAAPISALAD